MYQFLKKIQFNEFEDLILRTKKEADKKEACPSMKNVGGTSRDGNLKDGGIR